MKKILSTAILCMLVSMTFAQKSKVKEARKALDSDKFSEARQLIQPTLTDPETAEDPDAWKTAGDIEYKVYDKETIKQIRSHATQEKANEDLMYSSLYKTLDPYLKADELAEKPDEKGKVKNKVRKEIIEKLKNSHIDYYNGGAYYSEKKEASKAADFFERYWTMPSLPILAGEKSIVTVSDTSFQIIKYYAVISAIQAKQHEKAIGMLKRIDSEPFTPNPEYKESDVQELLASQYEQLGDTVKFIEALEAGAKKYPQNPYFVTNIINSYIRKKQADKAVAYLDQAIVNDPSNACELYSVKASIFAEKLDYNTAFESYEKAIATDANCERALEGLGVVYILKAQEMKEEATKAGSRAEQTRIDNEANEFYKKAYPLLERYKSLLQARGADVRDIKAALYKLRNVYYNLNMESEFNTADKEWESL